MGKEMGWRSMNMNSSSRWILLCSVTFGLAALIGWVASEDVEGAESTHDLNMGITPDADKGYEILMNEPMAAPIMKEKDLERLWTVWDARSKMAAADATPE